MNMKNIQRGFTLIELLVVILIISILSVTVFVALNPSKRLSDARDSKRFSNVETILTAVHEYIVDNGGDAAGLSMTAGVEYQMGTAASGCTSVSPGCSTMAAACLNLSTALAPYLKSIPFDPKTGVGSAATTGYKITKDSNGIITVAACASESAVVSASR
jgi:prepilin-type N-terminal cleavage/methylation domain-containing protein